MRLNLKEEWKSVSMKSGQLSVMTSGGLMMPVLFVDNLDYSHQVCRTILP